MLILEAGGPDDDPNIPEVGGFVSLWGSAVDWKLNTEGQPGLAGRRISINQGKVVGGSTSINAMMYVRGNRRNFDQWAAMGADGWGYADVLPCFKQLEDYEGGASEYRGVGGPISVRDCPDAAVRSTNFTLAPSRRASTVPAGTATAPARRTAPATCNFTSARTASAAAPPRPSSTRSATG